MTASCRARAHAPGGTYYVVQRVGRHQSLLRNEEDRCYLERIVARSLSHTRTASLAYCWLPEALHLAVRSDDIIVSRFMQGWTSTYARYLHRSTSETGHLFRQRFQSILIEPFRWLPELVRFIHYIPVRERLVGSSSDYLYSSCAAYSGITTRPRWLHMQPTLNVLHQRGLSDALARDFLRSTPSASDLSAFDGHNAPDSRILGNPEVPNTAHFVSHRKLTTERVIAQVAQQLDLTPAAITSASRTRRLALARAMVAWHVTARRLTSLTGVSAMLHRHPSTLSKSILRHQRTHPHLFRLDAFHHSQPLSQDALGCPQRD